MKDIESLKVEQEQLKERLHKLIDFMNSDEYYSLDINWVVQPIPRCVLELPVTCKD